MAKILITEDEDSLRMFVARALRLDGHETHEAGDGAEGLEKLSEGPFDLLLSDIRMPVMDGIEATRRIVAESLAKVLVLTTFDHDEYVFDGLTAGASGFLLKNSDAEHLVDAVRTVAAGHALLAPQVTRRVIEQMVAGERPPAGTRPDLRQAQVPAGVALLTPREREVLELVGTGLSNAEIAATLYLGEATVKTHVSNLLSKLHLRDRVQAVVLAHRAGLV